MFPSRQHKYKDSEVGEAALALLRERNKIYINGIEE
jgi:hypothetical protein